MSFLHQVLPLFFEHARDRRTQSFSRTLESRVYKEYKAREGPRRPRYVLGADALVDGKTKWARWSL
jgi:hypothetical protein